MARVGVDVGGTNTDLVLEADHGVFFHKVASTPHDQSEGVLKGLRELCQIASVRPNDVALIVHGTTVATNITIEHNGAEVGMLTSRNSVTFFTSAATSGRTISRFTSKCRGSNSRWSNGVTASR